MIRKATNNDISRVLEIKERVVPIMVASGNTQWSDEYPNKQVFLKDIENEALFVHEHEGEVAAFVVSDNIFNENYDCIDWKVDKSHAKALHRLAVDPEFQGLGITLKIIDELESMFKPLGFKAFHTDTSVDNKPMQRRFEKMGFEQRGKLKLDKSDQWYVAYEKLFINE